MDYDVSKTSDRLKLSRKAKKLTQDQVAERAHQKIQQSTISDYERGKRPPEVEDIFLLSRLYGVSADYLLGLQEDPTSNIEMKAITQTLGISEAAIKNIMDISRYYESIHDGDFQNEPYFKNLPSRILASKYFKNLIIEFFQMLIKYRAASERLSEIEENPDNIPISAVLLPDDVNLLRYGKYSLGEYCNRILDEITSGIKGCKTFDEMTKEAETFLQNLIGGDVWNDANEVSK